MQTPNRKRVTTILSPPPLLTIQATPCEIIFLQAALHHYLYHLRYDPQCYQHDAPLIQNFIQRLHDQIGSPRMAIQATTNELTVFQAALQHYQMFVRSDRDLYQAAPPIQSFLQRLDAQRKEHTEAQ